MHLYIIFEAYQFAKRAYWTRSLMELIIASRLT